MINIPEKLIDYDNKRVRYRFSEHYNIPFEDISDIFDNLKLFLFVSFMHETERGRKIDGFGDLFVIEEMWRNFIVFTEDYKDFCKEMFGGFFHHRPLLIGESLDANHEEDDIDYIESCVGGDTVYLWFCVWGNQYNQFEMHKRRILPCTDFQRGFDSV